MTTAYTSLLGLALPVQGELTGVWGDTVNNSITSLLDTSVAGTTNVSTDTDVTLTTTTGAANTARQAILLFSGARTALRTVTAPAQSKIYTVINATTGGFSVKLVGSGPTTGVTIVAGESAVCAWNGSDFIKISNAGGSGTFTNLTVTGNLTVNSLTTTRVPYASTSGLLVDSANMTFNGTTLTAGGLTSSGVLDVNGTTESSSITTGAAVIDGGVGIAKSLYVGGNATVTKDTGTSALRLQSLAPYAFPGDFSITAGGQSTPALTITDNTAAQERLNIFTGLTVFNEAGADQDFRIESDTQPNMFFLDAGNDRIGFKTNTPVGYLTVGGAYDQFLTFVDQRSNPSGTYDSYMAWQSFGTTPLLLGFTQNDYSNVNRRFFIKYANDNVPTYNERMGIGFYETVFNENSIDVDFRVESDGNGHMLFVDAGNNLVGVGTGSPSTIFTIGNAVNTPSFQDSNTRVWNLEFDVTENTNYQRFKITADATRRSCTVRIVYTPRSGGGNPSQNGGTAEFSIFRADGGVACSTISIFNAGGGGAASINLTVPTVSGNDVLFGFEVGNNGTGTNYTTEVRIELISYTPLDFTVATISGTTANTGNSVSGSFALFSNVENMRGSPSATIFNEQSADVDFRVESDTNTHALFVDAGNSRVGINNSSPSAELDVTGNIFLSSNLYVGGNATTSPVALNRAIYLNSTTNNDIIGVNMYVNDSANNRRGTLFLNDSTGVFGFDTTASSGVPTYVFYRAGSDFFHVGDDIVANEIGADIDFRVESDTNTHALFVDAGNSTVAVNTSSSQAYFNVQGTATSINSQQLGNGADQGTSQFNRVVKLCPSVSSNNKLIIPFVSQGSLNSTTICRVMGHNAAYNISTPYGFEITFAVGHLTAMYSLSYWGVGGNAVSAALNGQTVEITFTTAYNVSYGVSGGVFVTLEYMTNVTGYSIDVGSVRLN